MAKQYKLKTYISNCCFILYFQVFFNCLSKYKTMLKILFMPYHFLLFP